MNINVDTKYNVGDKVWVLYVDGNEVRTYSLLSIVKIQIDVYNGPPNIRYEFAHGSDYFTKNESEVMHIDQIPIAPDNP